MTASVQAFDTLKIPEHRCWTWDTLKMVICISISQGHFSLVMQFSNESEPILSMTRIYFHSMCVWQHRRILALCRRRSPAGSKTLVTWSGRRIWTKILGYGRRIWTKIKIDWQPGWADGSRVQAGVRLRPTSAHEPAHPLSHPASQTSSRPGAQNIPRFREMKGVGEPDACAPLPHLPRTATRPPAPCLRPPRPCPPARPYRPDAGGDGQWRASAATV